MEKRLIDGIIEEVTKNGTNIDSFARVSPVVDVMFPNGLTDFFEYYINDINKKAVRGTKKLKGIRNIIHHCIMKKFQLMNREFMQQCKGFLLLHPRLSNSLIWKTVDMFWYAAGDQATDFNYYTKRGLLYLVYVKSLNHWMADCGDTSVYVKGQLDKIVNCAKRFKSFLH